MYNFKYINLFNKEDEIKMSKKNILIEQIKQFDNKYFNEDQKTIAINILKNAPEQEVQSYADFLFNKRRTGFAFDYSPEISKGRLITLREDKNRRINVNDIISEDENKLIIGDNYNALKALLVTHKEKIDIIYIDPPYNTESAKTDGNNDSYKEGTSSKFIYKDKFGRTGWLNMMKDRLTLAKDLMKDDGVIFVSIDDSEQAYLKVLMDQIFGEENFVTIFNWITKVGGGNDSKNIRTVSEYILCYTKGKNSSIFDRMDSNNMSTYILEDEFVDTRGKYKKRALHDRGLTYSKKLDYVINYNSKKYYPGVSEINWLQRKKGNHGVKDYQWRWSLEKYNWGMENNFILHEEDMVYYKQYQFCDNNGQILKRQNVFSNLIDDIKGGEGTTELSLIFEHKKFEHPKPVSLIKHFLKIVKNKNALVLDFFAGSGTTGQAVVELNRDNDENRKFILVTNNENNIAYDVAFERLHRIIKGKGTKKEKDFDWLKNNKPYDDIKLRVINIDDSVKISLDQEKIDETIFEDCKNGLKLLDNEYNKKDLNLYYDLSALNPIEKIEE